MSRSYDAENSRLRKAESIYVENYSGDSITIYPADANGDVPPTRTIAGDKTRIVGPGSVAVDHRGLIYVPLAPGLLPLCSHSGTDSILVFSANAEGNVAPIRTISGPKTGLNKPFGIAVDQAGDIFVANALAFNVLKFDAQADGDVAPVATIAGSETGFSGAQGPLGISLDAQSRIFVTNVNHDRVLVFAPDSEGNVRPQSVIAGPATGLSGPIQAAFDSTGNIYVSDNGHSFPNPSRSTAISVFHRGATGNATPLATISGSNTNLGLPAVIAVDGAGRIFATNQLDNSVEVFAPGANGNVPPIAIIRGPNTQIRMSRAVAIH